MRTLSVITLLAALVLPPVAFAEVQTLTATHTYVMGDHDSKDDARQRCLLETKRKVLEQAGVYIESASEVKNFDLTKDKITSFAAAVMQVKDIKEEVSFQQGHMTLTLRLTAQVDLAEVRKQLAARQVDAGVRDTVVAQQERLKRIEAQLEAMQRQQGGQSSGRALPPSSSDVSAEDVQWLHTQAAQGNIQAQTNLGVLYHYGHGVLQDFVQARQWYERAAAQGDVGAQFNLGGMYDGGLGVPQDYAMARQWWEKAAAQGDASAQSGLGDLYVGGLGVQRNYTTARQWFEQAAAQGDASAQYNLGVMYSNGRGVPQNYEKARQRYEQAAAQGDASAQYNLGVMYSNGRGVPQDYAKARKWYEQAAAQGNPMAQLNLGSLYFNGEGVPQDLVRAYMWNNLSAASTGDVQTLATEYRDKVARRMTPPQIIAAQQLSQQCQAKQFRGC